MLRPQFAYDDRTPLSISLVLYSRRGEGAATTTRLFALRNLQSQTPEDRQGEALDIMDRVAEELHYLTGFGVDRGTLKMEGRKLEQHVYPKLVPQSPQSQFRRGVLLKVAPYAYYWVRGNERCFTLPAGSSTDGWEIMPWDDGRMASFRLPALIMGGDRTQDKPPSFFHYYPYSQVLTFDKADPIWLRFLQRLQVDGTLAFGDRRVFMGPSNYIDVQETHWSAPKRKKSKAPRRTVLASYPMDNTEYVYVIRMGRTLMYKIGISNNPGSRVAALQTANPHKLQLLHTFRADNAIAAEEALHRALHHTRQQGEWFRLTTVQRARLVAVQRFEDGYFRLETGPVTGDELVGEG